MIGKDLKYKLNAIPPVIILMAIAIISFSFTAENFFSMGNILNILIQASPLLVLSIGQTLIILLGGTDLSLGYVMSFTGLLCAYMLQAHFPLIVCIVLAVLVATAIGMINGILVSKFRIPYFIATYGVGNVFFGLGLLISGGLSVPALNRSFRYIADGKLFGFFPMIVVIAFAIFILMKLVMSFTSLGRDVHGLGGNREALFLSGVNVRRKEVLIFTITGALAGCAGIMFAARAASGHASSGVGWEFDSIAASVIGGNSFIEGRGGLNKTILGVIFICLIRNGLNMSGVAPKYQSTLVGMIVVLAISIDALYKKLR